MTAGRALPSSHVIPLQVLCKSHFSPILRNGLTTDLKRTYNGPETDLERRYNGLRAKARMLLDKTIRKIIQIRFRYFFISAQVDEFSGNRC